MANEQFKRSNFLAAAKDLIDTMGLKDDKGKPLPIDAKSNVAQLTKFILYATEEIDPGSDEFTPETLAILAHVGYTGFGKEIIPEEMVEASAEAAKKTKSKEDLADDADWKEPEPAEPLTLQQKVAAAKRLADLKDLVTGNLEFKKLVPKLKSYMGMQAPRMLKAEMQKIVGVPEVQVKPEKPVKEKKEKTNTRTISRSSALAKVVIEHVGKGSTSIQDLAAESDVLYISLGGKSNLKESLWITRILTKFLVDLGKASISDSGISISEDF